MYSDLVGYLAACVAAVILHEAAHVAVAWVVGIRIKRVGISWRGPYLVREQGPPLASFFVALAGPALNLLLAVGCWYSAPQFGLANLLLGTYNLLPFIRGVDGYHALAAYRKLRIFGQDQPVQSAAPTSPGTFKTEVSLDPHDVNAELCNCKREITGESRHGA